MDYRKNGIDSSTGDISVRLPTQEKIWASFISCYCSECKQALSEEHAQDSRSAWCPDCEKSVRKSCFKAPAWTIGSVVVVYTYLFMIW